MRIPISFALIISLSITCAGCADKRHGAGEKIVARINNYELTSADFTDEARLTAPNKYLSSDPKIAREEILDEIIVKKIVLQEAQRQNFDKDRAFMKEIERYWEQALLKLMTRKKMEELARLVTVSEREVRDEYERLAVERGPRIKPFEDMASGIKDRLYNRKVQEMFGEWLAKLKAGSDIKIYKENL